MHQFFASEPVGDGSGGSAIRSRFAIRPTKPDCAARHPRYACGMTHQPHHIDRPCSAEIDEVGANGFAVFRRIVPAEMCAALVEVLARELAVPLDDPARWAGYGRRGRDLLPIWGHQAQWDIRQHPALHPIWAALTGTPRLRVSLDSCRFSPPWRPGYAEPYGIHWDHNPWDAGKRMFQGVLALTETTADQGGFCCVPSLLHDRAAWPTTPAEVNNGEEEWLADTAGREIVHVAAQPGDLVVWDSRLAHGNSKNLGTRPRLAFYVAMGSFGDKARDASVESWRSGRCVPWWRKRHGYARIEPWPPASLTPLGRRLLGLDDWPAESAAA
jgi:hypothetical protein